MQKITKFLTIYTTLAIASITSSFANNHYEIYIVQSAEKIQTAILGGRVISSSVVNLSSQVGGDITNVFGTEGSYFSKNDKIITIESKTIEAERDSAIAEVSSATQALENAKVRYSQSIISPNSNQMFGGMFNTFTDPMNQFMGNSDPNFDKFANRADKFTGVRQAENRLIQAKAKLKQATERLQDTTIVAPFDGVVIAKTVNTGDTVHPGQNLLQFSNLKQLQVEVNVPSRLMSSLQVGKQYRIKIDTIPTPIVAKLAQIYPIADNNKHSIKIKLNLPENTPILPGIYAELELTSKSGKKPPIIPHSAVLWRSSLPSVFVVNKYNKTELRFIRTGQMIDNNNIEVLSGLKIGQRIVANPDIFTQSDTDI
jgi:multidrug efflux pump subunit AcrA (membrane-fusion protein)